MSRNKHTGSDFSQYLEQELADPEFARAYIREQDQYIQKLLKLKSDVEFTLARYDEGRGFDLEAHFSMLSLDIEEIDRD